MTYRQLLRAVQRAQELQNRFNQDEDKLALLNFDWITNQDDQPDLAPKITAAEKEVEKSYLALDREINWNEGQ